MTAPNPLETLAQQAEGMAAEQQQDQAAPAVQAETAKPSNGELLGGMFAMVRDMACMVLDLQSPRVTFPDNDAAALGQAWGAVCDKRGWDVGRVMGDYGAEVAAALLTVTLAKRIATAAKAELATRPGAVTDVQPKGEGAAAPAPEPEAASVG